MNRALLERMNSYQPKPGIASISPSKFNIAFWCVASIVVSVVVWTVLLVIDGCSPAGTRAAAAQAEIAAKAEEYGSEVHQCLVDASDGGTFRSFQACACKVDRKYHVDAAGAGAECP